MHVQPDDRAIKLLYYFAESFKVSIRFKLSYYYYYYFTIIINFFSNFYFVVFIFRKIY